MGRYTRINFSELTDTSVAYDPTDNSFRVKSASAIIMPSSSHLEMDCVSGTNAQNIKTSSVSLYSILATNYAASPRYLKIYNKPSKPTVGVDVPIMDIILPANQTSVFNFGAVGVRVSGGFGIALTMGAGNTDAVGVGAGDVKIVMAF